MADAADAVFEGRFNWRLALALLINAALWVGIWKCAEVVAHVVAGPLS